MALLSALFSLLAKQLSTVLKAIFGWSITALFGQLPSKKQTALSGALLLSIAWPLLVLGCFLPGVASWALAFVPIHHWMSDLAIRILWLSLAVVVPILVGGITRWITPKEKLRGKLAFTVFVGGYVMTLGYFVAFVVTALTVPIVKIMSTVRRWQDWHVYVQPKEDRYFAVLASLVEACKRLGTPVVQEDVPRPMALATMAVQKLAQPFLQPIVAERPQRLRGKHLEIYLYPADLLLRGEPHLVAHVRAAMTRTNLEKDAFLVESPAAQKLQEEIHGLCALKGSESASAKTGALARLQEVSGRLDRASIPFEEWTTLESSLRRVERAIEGAVDHVQAGSEGKSTTQEKKNGAGPVPMERPRMPNEVPLAPPSHH